MSTPQNAFLLKAQEQAYRLFDRIEALGLIHPGTTELALNNALHSLAQAELGIRTHWHKRIVRAGPNTLCQFDDTPSDRELLADDIVFLDLGPVFESFEADFGKTYVLGDDPRKLEAQRLSYALFEQCKHHFETTPELTAQALYTYAKQATEATGWQWEAHIAGHIIGAFPHKQTSHLEKPLSYISPENPTPLRQKTPQGETQHWILEIHVVDRSRQIGAFFEDFLTLPHKPQAFT